MFFEDCLHLSFLVWRGFLGFLCVLWLVGFGVFLFPFFLLFKDPVVEIDGQSRQYFSIKTLSQLRLRANSIKLSL